MRFLQQNIPDAPADCPNASECALRVAAAEMLAAITSATTQEILPDSPTQEVSAADEADLERAVDIRAGISPYLDKYRPVAQRCGGCVLTAAQTVLREGGAV